MRLSLIVIASALLSQDAEIGTAQTRADSLGIADAAVARALENARRQEPATTHLIILRSTARTCRDCVNHLLEAVGNPILIVGDVTPLCPWDGGSRSAGLSMSISDLNIGEDHATLYAGLSCARAGGDDSFGWVLEYQLAKRNREWIVTVETSILIT